MPKNKFRLTKTLLDSWIYSFKRDTGYEDFIKTLNREKIQPNKKMLLGQQFENCVNGVLNGNYISPNHEWYDGIMLMAEHVQGSQQQVVLFRDIKVDGINFMMHGVLDYLRAGIVFDCKFTKNYTLNHYLNSTQHPVYMYLVPEARQFEYCISDGKYLYIEKYPREIIPDLEPIIKYFMAYLDRHNLVDTYVEHWRVNE